ncbi:AMP-binding protein [Pseudomaricurvus alkylphenolicus]|uniref:AMP-binding protein n=1 Tax=Pseudomaricurvus alkylphenolicus TaxID=1306991 RepID=UPI0014212E41|nr:AMP-binding protein [Pseudomaricurvus alkylphenolicus]NIB40878.1 AMP-binding protein [Pseudomaricurvus alkylphenolicus]
MTESSPGLYQSYMCGDATEALLYETIGNYFDRVVKQHPDSEALVVSHQNIRWTYREFQQQIDRLATGLLKLGIKPGDRVGIWGPNSFEWCLTQFATAKIGAIMVCINPAYRIYELEYALNKVECKAIIAAESFKTSMYLDMLQELAPELNEADPRQLQLQKLPHMRMIIRMGEAHTPGMLNFGAVCEMGGDTEAQRLLELSTELKPDDPINIQFTSGTTGRPKGATLTHCNILNNGYFTAKTMGFTPDDRLCIPVPLYHCFGMVLAALACISTASAAVYPSDAFDPLTTLQVIEKERCTALHGVPTMFIAELDHPEFASFDLSSLRTGVMAGAPCPEEVMKRVMGDMHMEHILIGYGQTEVSPLNHLTKPQDPVAKRIETVGKAFPRVEVKVADAEGRPVAIGEKGEICTRGYSVMLGYWNDEEKTAETIDSAGWLHSGDIGIMDAEGYVRVVGRTKDMVIRGGENVYPREVEEFLYGHPAIQEVQVFGVPDERMGEEVCAWIKLMPDMELTDAEVKAYCKGNITHFKIPRYIEFVDDYPMTVTGKIQKFKMREAMSERLGQEA